MPETLPALSAGARVLMGARLAALAVICLAATAILSDRAAPATQAAMAPTASASVNVDSSVDSMAISARSTNLAPAARAASPIVGSLPASATPPGALPVTALNAYTRTAEVMAAAKAACHLSWPVLAAIGQIESHHGQRGGAQLHSNGTSTPPIRGTVRKGPRSARITDTDGGQLDGDPAEDRAIGPMQFLPSTWISVRVDADDDGVRSPDDIDDASLAAAVYLCGWNDDLSTHEGARTAIGRYNHTPGYTSTVLHLARTYELGGYVSETWQDFLGILANPLYPAAAPTMTPVSDSAHDSTTQPSGTPLPATQPVGPRPTGPAVHQNPTPTSQPDPGSPAVTPPPAAATPTPAPPETSAPPAAATPTPASDEPSAAASPTPSPAEPSATTSEPLELAGVLRTCDEEFCVDQDHLDFGPLDSAATADLDGDGNTASRGEELTTLLGTRVVVVVKSTTTASAVTVNGQPW